MCAVAAAKVLKYLRSVLMDLLLLQKHASPILIDNVAACNIINERRPTPNSRHIAIQHFAIQEWAALGEILVKHLPGFLNDSDALTKAVGHALHYRHNPRMMGHYPPSYSAFYESSEMQDSATIIEFGAPIQDGSKAREGVGAQGIQDSIVAIGAESREGSRDSLGTKYEPPGDKPGERKQATKDLGTKDE